MKKLKLFSKRTLKNNKGQGMTEYILLLVVVVGLVMAFKKQISGIISGKIDKLGADIQSVDGGSGQ